MNGPIEMQNTTVVIVSITEIANAGIIGCHHFDCTMQHTIQNFLAEKTHFSTSVGKGLLVWADSELPKSSSVCVIDPAPI